ncbi:hypothetical protein FDUTEX481_05146 [Tolypothrix sp. PCC 7601]|nr:hypothetical protein FDUTEX481_05146 [Tolypothrix sp. PCC 7601]
MYNHLFFWDMDELKLNIFNNKIQDFYIDFDLAIVPVRSRHKI